MNEQNERNSISFFGIRHRKKVYLDLLSTTKLINRKVKPISVKPNERK